MASTICISQRTIGFEPYFIYHLRHCHSFSHNRVCKFRVLHHFRFASAFFTTFFTTFSTAFFTAFSHSSHLLSKNYHCTYDLLILPSFSLAAHIVSYQFHFHQVLNIFCRIVFYQQVEDPH